MGNPSLERLNTAAASGLILRELLLVSDLALALRRTKAAIRSLLRHGLLPGRKVGRTWVTTRIDLLRHLSSGDARFRVLSPERERRP